MTSIHIRNIRNRKIKYVADSEKAVIQKEKTLLEFLTPYVIAIVVSSLLSVLIMNRYHPVVVQGNSMSPAYHNGDILTCETAFTKDSILRGDVIIFTKDNTTYIKRVIGLPGETIIIFRGYVYINYERLSDYHFGTIKDGGIAALPLEIGDDQYFCIGDNYGVSKDSRIIGTVDFDEIDYVVKDILFSLTPADAEDTENTESDN